MKRNVFYLMILGWLVLGVIPKTAQVLGEEQKLRPLELDGTVWTITLTSEQGKAQTSNDTFTFKDKKFSSTNLEKQKYSPTNYTLSVKDDGSTVFETMQTKDKDVVFWQGIVQDQKLRGVMSNHLAKGGVKDYFFTGTLASGVLKLQEPVVAEPSAPAQQPEQAAQDVEGQKAQE